MYRNGTWRVILYALVLTLFIVGVLVAAQLGDVNNDGRVDLKDALKVFRIADSAEPGAPEERAAADVFPNPGSAGRAVGDGQVTRDDADRLLRFVVGQFPLGVLQQSAVLAISPARANVVVGTPQQFTAVSPDGSGVVWSVEGTAGANLGSIDQNGLYTAPAQIPDPPFAIVRARSQRNPGVTNTAVVTLLSAADIRVTREQATATVMERIVDRMPNKEAAIAFMTQQPLTPQDEVVAAPLPDAVATQTTTRTRACWFSMVDPTPEANWYHDVRYVFLDCATGAIVEDRMEKSFPLINGTPFWWRVADRATNPERFFAGRNILPLLQDAANDTTSTNRNFSRIRRQGTLFRDIFPPDPDNACPSSGGPRRLALVIADDTPEDTFRGILFEKFAIQNTEFRLRNNGLLMSFALADAGFTVTSLLGRNETTRGAIAAAFADLRSQVRPGDAVVVYLTAHGDPTGAGELGFGFYRNVLAAIPTNSKFFIVDACNSGGAIDVFQTFRDDPRVTVVTSSRRDKLSNVVFSAPTFSANFLPPEIRGILKPTAFTNAFLTCALTSTSLDDAVACTVNLGDSFVSNPGPQRLRVGGADPDNDAVIDGIEINALGTNPQDTDSDGDGVCDGVEFGRIPIGNVLGGKLTPPRITNDPLPDGRRGTNYSFQFNQTGGIVFNSSAPSENNPFGFGPRNGWTVVAGDNPADIGLNLNRFTGDLSGIPTRAGSIGFTVQFMDGIGAVTQRTVQVTIVDPNLPQTADISVSAGRDGNARDDDLTLREAVLLATGKLNKSDLKEDPDPNDGKPEGEVRFVQGNPGAMSSDSIRVSAGVNEIVLTGGSLILDTDADTVSTPLIRAQDAPVFEIRSNNNFLSTSIIGPSGNNPAILITGKNNVVFASVQNAGGAAVLIRGNGNGVRNGTLQNNAEGVRLEAGASNNQVENVTIIGNRGDGVVITDGAKSNTVTNCNIGVRLVNAQTEQFEVVANGGNGVLMNGGAQSNDVSGNTIGGNGGSGVLITGQNTTSNTVGGNGIGGIRARRGIVAIGANGQNGVVISNAASNNSVIGNPVIVGNTGHGILITGQGTNNNTVRGSPLLRDNTGDAIRIEAGAQGNVVRDNVFISQSNGNGIAIVGSGTSVNEIAGDITAQARLIMIQNTTLAGIRIADGASGNLVSGVSIGSSGDGIVMEGAGTTNNAVSNAFIRNSVNHGIKFSGGCQKNRINGTGSSDPSAQDFRNVTVGSNNGSSIFITGAGTSDNQVIRCVLGDRRDKRHGVEITDGAQNNIVTECAIVEHTLGGILLSGANTRRNLIVDNRISGAIFDNDVPLSGAGVILTSGAQENFISANEIGPNGKDGVVISGMNTINNALTANRVGIFGDGLVTVEPPSFQRVKRQGNDVFLIPNRGNGILIDNAPQNIIGSAVGGGNFISGNTGDGVHITGANAAGNRVMGNLIGTDSSGMKAAPNDGNGITITNGAHDNTIGGARPVERPTRVTDLGAGNLISANKGSGVRITGAGIAGNNVLGNLIGFSFGQTPLGNAGDGITIEGGAQQSCIGNCVSLAQNDPNFSNLITSNSGAGVRVVGANTTGHTISRNTIRNNGRGDILLENGGNGGVLSPILTSFDLATGRVSGVSPGRGFLELFVDLPGDEGVFQLAAFVRAGVFSINLFRPFDSDQSQNAAVFDSAPRFQPGTLRATFTDSGSLNTSAFSQPITRASRVAQAQRLEAALLRAAVERNSVGNGRPASGYPAVSDLKASRVKKSGTKLQNQNAPRLEVAVPQGGAVAGNTVDIGINAVNFSNIGGVLFDLSYDPDSLSLENVTLRAAANEAALLASNPDTFPSESGLVRIGALFARGRSGNSSLMTLRFRVKPEAQGATPLDIENVVAVDVNGQDVAVDGIGAALPMSWAVFEIPSGLQLFTLPIRPANPDPAAVFGVPAANLALFSFDPGLNGGQGGYIRYDGSNLQIAPGRGFWLRSDVARQVLMRVGEFVDETQPFTIAAPKGFSLLGNPFRAPLTWDVRRIRVRQNGQDVGTLEDAFRQGIAKPFAFGFDGQQYFLIFDRTFIPDVTNTVAVAQGIWVLADRDGVEFVFPPPPAGQMQRLARTRRERNPAPHPSRWAVELRARCGTLTDRGNYLGISDATSGAKLQIAAPPAAPNAQGFLDLALLSDEETMGQKLSVSLQSRPVVERTVWRAAVITDQPNADVALSWDNLNRQLPKGYQMYLVDEATGARRYMRTTSTYTFRSEPQGITQRTFRIEVTPARSGAPLLSRLSAQADGAGNWRVLFSLGQEAHVQWRVLSPTGKVIFKNATVGKQGLNVLSWDSKSQRGTIVPRGVYVMQVVAEAADGQVVQAAQMVTVR